MPGIADPPSQPSTALLVEVGAYQEQQPGGGEDDEEWEEELEAQRDVRQQEEPEHDQGIHRSVAAEDREGGVGARRPGDAAGHEQERGGLRRAHLADEQVDARSGPARRSGRWIRAVSSAALEFTSATSTMTRAAPMPAPTRCDEGRRQLRLGADEAPRATGQEHERQEPGAAVAGDRRARPSVRCRPRCQGPASMTTNSATAVQPSAGDRSRALGLVEAAGRARRCSHAHPRPDRPAARPAARRAWSPGPRDSRSRRARRGRGASRGRPVPVPRARPARRPRGRWPADHRRRRRPDRGGRRRRRCHGREACPAAAPRRDRRMA